MTDSPARQGKGLRECQFGRCQGSPGLHSLSYFAARGVVSGNMWLRATKGQRQPHVFMTVWQNGGAEKTHQHKVSRGRAAELQNSSGDE